MNINPVIVLTLLGFFGIPALGYYATYYIAWWKAALIANALAGMSFFEICWFVGQRFRDGDEERDKLFPAFRRTDAHNWSRWKFYPCVLTIFWLRVFIGLGSFCVCVIPISIVTFGHDFKKPLTGWRRKAKEFFYTFHM